MSTQHTQGPWVINANGDITSPHGAVCWLPAGIAERSANAFMLAAAPAMYEALKALVDVIPSVVKMIPYGVPMDISQLHDNAKAAMAQAEGW